MFIELINKVEYGGLDSVLGEPERGRQTRLETWIKDYFARQSGGQYPNESLIRSKAQAILKQRAAYKTLK
jgi:hypothetical protein